MKKLLILSASLLTGGLILPAHAQSQRGHSSSSIQIFVSGHLPCGSPIYSKRVQHGHHYHNERLSSYELRRYLEQQRRIAAQRELQRQIARARYYQQSSRHGSYCSQGRRR